jgi:phosphate transport system substrate-binding protein
LFYPLELAVENQNQPAPPATASPKRTVWTVPFVVFAVFAVVLGVGIYLSPRFLAKEEEASPLPRLKLGGTSTVFVIVENGWMRDYRDKKGVQLAYESTGSTAGVNRLADKSFTVAFTHAALSPEQLQSLKQKGGEVVQIPILLCGVAPVYNVKELKGKAPLKLTGEVLADIFLGKIKEWNDRAIKALNPGVELPATGITVVHREDSSGTTHIFTQYLAAVSKAWREQVGPPASEIKWPVGVAAARNLGVASKVDETEGAIGYVDRMFTTYDQMVLDYAAIENRDKTGFVRAEPENMTAAAGNIHDDLSLSLANQPGKEAYPISGVIYAICYQGQPQATYHQVVDFLRWAAHEGQARAAQMTYAPLPTELVKRIEPSIESIKATQ